MEVDKLQISQGRNSAVELLRIIAMFMILALHVNFLALGQPLSEDFHANPGNAFLRYFFEIICIGAVDLFVLISGWFGIRPTRKGLLKFLFQSFFIITFVNVLGIITSNEISVKTIIWESLFFSHAWFVIAYAGLYIITPILNTFIKNTSYRTYRLTVIAFFVFQTI